MSAELLLKLEGCTVTNAEGGLLLGTASFLHIEKPSNLYFLIVEDAAGNEMLIPLLANVTIIRQIGNGFEFISPPSDGASSRYHLEFQGEGRKEEIDTLSLLLDMAIKKEGDTSFSTSTLTRSIPLNDMKEPRLFLLSSKGETIAEMDPTSFPLAEDKSLSDNDVRNSIVVINPATTATPSVPNLTVLDQSGDYMVKAGSLLATAISTGTVWAGWGIEKGKDILISNTSKNKEPLQISPSTTRRLQTLRGLSHTAVKLSSATLSMVVSASKKVGSSARNAAYGKEQKGPSYMRFATKGMVAWSIVSDATDESLKKLSHDARLATQDFVGYRYGKEAEEAAEELMGSVKNATLVYVNIKGLGRKAILKSLGKELKCKIDNQDVLISSNTDGTVNIKPVASESAPVLPHRK